MARSVFARLARIVRARLRGGDDGFMLLESMIAMAIITIVMAAVGAEFVTTTIDTSHQRADQVAVQVAGATVEQLRALHPSDLVVGRDSASVASQFTSAPSAVQPWLANMDPAVDSSARAGAGATATIPTAASVQKPGTISYSVSQYLGWCYIPASGTTNCLPKAQITATTFYTYLRAVVAVSWSQSACPSSGCFYLTSTLISVASDSTFQVSQSLPPAPTIVDPGSQAASIGDTVSLTLKTLTGVPPYIWSLASGSFPTGLVISPAGLISGTVAGSTGTYTSTVQVTDAFLRSQTLTITWTVTKALGIAQPTDQNTVTGTSASLALSASGGTGTGYTWAVKTGSLPTGLSLNSSTGAISGTPTSAGTYPITVQVTDSGKHVATTTFTWTTTYPPLTASGTTITGTVGGSVTGSVTASGGSGTYTFAVTAGALADGLTLNKTTGVISGSPTKTGSFAATVTVSDTAGNTATASVTMTISSAQISLPSTLAVTEGASASASVTYTCPATTCTLSATGLPPGISLAKNSVSKGTSTVEFAGTVASTAVTGSATSAPYSVTVAISVGSTSTTATSTWTAYAPPTVSFASTKVAEGSTPSIPVSFTCPNSPCKVQLANTVPGLGLSKSQVNSSANSTMSFTVTSLSSTVYINGLVSGSAVTWGSNTGYTPVVTITDSSKITGSSSPGVTAWTQPMVATPDGATPANGASFSQQLSYACPSYPGLWPWSSYSWCTISVTGLPTGVGVSTSSGGAGQTSVNVGYSGSVYLTGTAQKSGTKSSYVVTVTITDNYGGVTTSSVGTWTVTG